MNGYTDEKILMLMLVLFLLMLMLMRQLMVLLMLMLNVDVDVDIVTLVVAHFGAYHRPSDGHFIALVDLCFVMKNKASLLLMKF